MIQNGAEYMYRIMLVEDDKELGETIKSLLVLKGYDVELIGSVKEYNKHTEVYDMYLLDVKLPDGDGFQVCEKIRHNSDAPIIFITSCDDEESIVRGLDIGGDDYVTKPFNPLELVARVKSQLRRYTTLSSNDAAGDKVYEAGGLLVNDDLKKVTVDGEEVKLTPIEYNILLLLLKNKGKVYSINEIYESIWNEEAIGADNTVAVHIRHIREKIEINPKEPRYLKVVWGVGYKIEDNK